MDSGSRRIIGEETVTMSKYSLLVGGRSERFIAIEIVDDRWTIAQIVRGLSNCEFGGDHPIHETVVGCDTWSGEIIDDGSLIARFSVEEDGSPNEVEAVFDCKGNELDLTTVGESD
jgi:hypothetical protein